MFLAKLYNIRMKMREKKSKKDLCIIKTSLGKLKPIFQTFASFFSEKKAKRKKEKSERVCFPI